ncbi:DNA topoisomerase I, mitochondrial [Anopheles coustani]|uniref:DNA topoisomerase I, mitochondrial n=1 Tax=Anopheles coustani TaxID=139045 RepID=UPI0026597AD0|nr:DNA topoisomerase I, mitochondrial [Anopheles coustani]
MSVETAIPPAGHPQPADSLKQMNGTADRPNGVSNGHAGSGGENGERQKSSHKSSSKDKHRDKDRDHHRSDKDKNREKDKGRDKDREREKDKSRDKDRDKHKSSSGTGGSHSSSSKSGSGGSSKDKERSDKDKQSSSGSSGNKDKEKTHHSSSSSHKSSKSDKDKDRSKDKDRDKDSKHRSREDGKDRSDRDKKDRDKSKSSSDKDKHKSSSSSSSNKDKDREKHKTSSSSSGRDKHSSSSSSKRDKEKSSSSSSSKHKDRRDGKEQRDNAASSVPGEVKIKGETDAAPPGFLNGEGHLVAPGDATANNRAAKERDPLDISQASSCDYSMSQFRADETPFPQKNEPVDHNQSNQDGEYQDEDDDEGDAESGDNEGSGNENGHFNHQQQQQAQHYQNQGGYFGGMQQQHEQYQASMNQIQIKHEPLDIKAEPYETQIKQEEDSEDEIPLSKRKKKDSDEAYEEGSSKKKKIKTEKKEKKKNKKRSYESGEDNDDDGDYGSKKTKKSKVKKEPVHEAPKPTKGALKTEVKTETTRTKGGRQKKKEEEEEQEVWKWWEEEKREDGSKWTYLEHKGPVFAPAYEPLPPSVTFEYAGKKMRLSEGAEEVAGFYARMLDHDYTSKKAFNENFFKDWRKTMTQSEREIIKDLGQCNFRSMASHFAMVAEQNRNRTKEQKAELKAANDKMMKEYGICVIDGHKEKIGNFKIEPPGLFRGRGEHPKMGLVKRRVMPEDVIINCSKDSKVPVPPAGHRWKEVRHDNGVSWLASWVENVQGQVKYVMLNPSSKLKGEKDWQKYETARSLLKHIDQIRNTYREEWKSKEMRIRQRAVAMYFIDKLALRAGNEKDEDQADTVGCCSLRVEHIQLCKELNGKENVVVFDFLGKDSIRYYNEVAVEKRVFKNLELFKENKKTGDDLFDRLNTSVLNEYLKNLMEGLTAKVFRTFNASFTLQKQLEELTDPNMTVPEKLLAYNRANRAVAILCNHQRAVPKTHEKSMGNLKEKIRLKREQVEQCQQELKDLNKSNVRDATAKDKKTKQLERLMEQLKKLELMETDKDENKTIALGTSKLNYLDPRISVAWCKKFGVPIEKIFNKTQRDKFRWAIDMADENYVF